MQLKNFFFARMTFSVVWLIFFFCSFPMSSNADDTAADIKMLDQYISSKGYHTTISFDASNIKQFWIDNSILSKDNCIKVFLSSTNSTTKESVPLKIQLTNVNESQDCKIDVISKSSPIHFFVSNSNLKTISSSSEETPFVDYNISSAIFHLENTPDSSFYLKFSSSNQDQLSIQKIVLSFPRNQNSMFLASPGTLKLNIDKVSIVNGKTDDSFSVTGKTTQVISKNNILIPNSPLESSVTVKNTGATPTRIYIGYAVYNKNRKQLKNLNYPYNSSTEVFTVLSSEKDSNRIVIDSLPSIWKTNCYLALDAKDDLSDIPNTLLIPGTITDIHQLPNNQAEIIMSSPLSEPIAKGAKVRINGLNSGNLYTDSKVLQPGEEAFFNSKIQKDDNYLAYSSKAFSRGIYYVKPVILSFSIDSKEDNTIQIKDFSVSY